MRLIDLTGKRFGRLVVIRREGSGKKGQPTWLCRCDCGKRHVVPGRVLRAGVSKSCGCLRREVPHSISHGQTKSRLYHIWQSMKRRCLSPSSHAYHRYGGRGIKLDSSWLVFEVFRDWAVAAGYEDHLTIDRINNDGNYTPENCRWVDRKTQNNNRRSNRNLTFRGETLTATQWAERTGIPCPTIISRLARGWPIERALTEPRRKQCQ